MTPEAFARVLVQLHQLKSRAKLPANDNAFLRFPATQRAKHQLGNRHSREKDRIPISGSQLLSHMNIAPSQQFDCDVSVKQIGRHKLARFSTGAKRRAEKPGCSPLRSGIVKEHKRTFGAFGSTSSGRALDGNLTRVAIFRVAALCNVVKILKLPLAKGIRAVGSSRSIPVKYRKHQPERTHARASGANACHAQANAAASKLPGRPLSHL